MTYLHKHLHDNAEPVSEVWSVWLLKISISEIQNGGQLLS